MTEAHRNFTVHNSRDVHQHNEESRRKLVFITEKAAIKSDMYDRDRELWSLSPSLKLRRPNLVKTSQRTLLVVTIEPMKTVREKIKYSLRAPTSGTRRTFPCSAAKISPDKQFET